MTIRGLSSTLESCGLFDGKPACTVRVIHAPNESVDLAELERALLAETLFIAAFATQEMSADDR